MRIIRASELSSYVYCRRAWWYKCEGLEPAQGSLLEQGRDHHASHAKRVTLALRLKSVAHLLLFSALGLIVLQVIDRWG